jgi:cell fate regulator YaaT (PSP1 superfamily)
MEKAFNKEANLMDLCGKLCSSCSRHCGEYLKHEMAMDGKLTYLYLKNGNKIAHTCMLHSKRVKIPSNNVMNIMSTIKAAAPKSSSGLALSFPKA